MSASALRIVFWILPKTKVHKDVKAPNYMTRIRERKQMRVRKWKISGNNHLSRFNHKIFNLQYLNFYLQKYLFCLFLLFKYSKIIINNKKQWLVCGFALSDYSFIAYPIFSITFSITVEFVGIPSPNNYFKDDIVLQIVPQWYKLVNFTRNKFFFKETCIDRSIVLFFF